MAINVDAEYNKLAQELTVAYQNELRKQGLVETGKLLNSIKFKAIRTSQGYKLSMEALDYFKFLDEKYKISDNVFKSVEYKRIQDRLADIQIQIILGDL